MFTSIGRYVSPPTPYELSAHRRWIVGLDLGQSQDYSALVVVEPTGDQKAPVHDVRHIERIPLNTSYPDVVRHTVAIVDGLRAIKPERPIFFALDFTGVGHAVLDLFLAEKKAGRLHATIVAVSIHGGDSVTKDGIVCRVPKRDLASIIQVLLQSDRLRIAEGLPMAKELTAELKGFRVKINLKTGHDSYAAGEDWRSAAHDDLVLALAIACWLQKTEKSKAIRGHN